MQAGTFVSSDVQALTSRVTVNGETREHVSWSVSRELSGDMPDQVVAVSGIMQATGTIEWATAADVSEIAPHPFNASSGWVPRKGARVVIYAGDGTSEWVQFTGVIDKSTGNIRGGFQSSIIDDYDKLSASVSHLPLLRIMPPLVETEPYRAVGLSAIHYVNHALRTAGFYSTPPTEYDAAVAVDCQGSMLPNSGSAGTLTAGGSDDGSASHHSNNTAPWGWSVGNFQNTYTPRVSYASTVAVQLTAMVAADHAGSFFLTAYYGSSNTVGLSVTSERIAILRVNGTEACRVGLGSGTIVTALLKGGAVTLKTNTGTTATGSATIGGTAMSSVLTSGDSPTRVAGIQVSHPNATSREFASLNWVPSAVLDLSNVIHIGLMDAGPGIENESAADLLKRISSALLAGVWIDELGVLRFVPTLALKARTSSRTLTTLDDILDLDWEDSLLGSRSRVTVTGKIPAIDKGRYRNRELYQGSGESLRSGDEKVQFIGPESDVDWIMPDTNPQIINSGAVETSFNAGRGSFFMATKSSDSSTVDAWGQAHVTFGLTQIASRTYKLSHIVGSLASDEQIKLQTADDPDLWPKWRGYAGPIIRGFGRVEWAPVSVSPVSAGGIGPELVHDVDVWNNRTDSNEFLDRIANYLTDQTATPKPVITGLGVVDDPRLQLGDVVTLSSDRLLGVTMTALIVGMTRSADSSGTTLSLSVRIIDVTTTYTTYEAYNAELTAANLTYEQWQALGPLPETYDQFNDAS